ncbi:MAG: hypothetical protein ACRDZ8_00350 [Acidimicrobiales bacterium]
MNVSDFDREKRLQQLKAGYSETDRADVWQLVASGNPPLHDRRALAWAYVNQPPWMVRADTMLQRRRRPQAEEGVRQSCEILGMPLSGT